MPTHVLPQVNIPDQVVLTEVELQLSEEIIPQLVEWEGQFSDRCRRRSAGRRRDRRHDWRRCIRRWIRRVEIVARGRIVAPRKHGRRAIVDGGVHGSWHSVCVSFVALEIAFSGIPATAIPPAHASELPSDWTTAASVPPGRPSSATAAVTPAVPVPAAFIDTRYRPATVIGPTASVIT